MIDIKNLRDDINAVSKSLQRRGYNLDIEKFTSLDANRKKLQVNVENLQSTRKKLSQTLASLRPQILIRLPLRKKLIMLMMTLRKKMIY